MRWLIVGIAVVIGLAVAATSAVPYLPLIHGSEADEVDRLVEWLALEPGSRVADLGAGDGRFALALSDRVGPAGHVYATELSADQLATIRQAARQRGLDNVTVIQGAVDHTGLPEGCCDALFSRNVYHHLTEPDAINADIHRALRPGGRLLVIDFEPGGLLDRIAPAETAERHGGHGTPKQTVIEEVTVAGFRLVRGPEDWRGRLYAVLFERAD
jgi:ubiquinone/menaquinone biosynthesis C-methylase UbiE